jgi:phage shock protein A
VDDRSIGLLDIAGVNFAGVKALEARTTALQAENAELRAQNQRLEERLQRLEARVADGRTP